MGHLLAGARLLGAIDPDWLDTLRTDFMRNAMVGGVLVAMAAGLLGYFVVVRQHAFAAHALAHIGFPGATGAVLVGAPVTLGLAVFCLLGALAIGAVGPRAAEREVATGTILAFATGLGVLFASLGSRTSTAVTNILFGNLLAVSPGQLVVFGLFTLGLAAVMAVVARPLVFASVNPQVAAARGVPVTALGVLFLVLLALVVTMAVQVVGTLLLFGLVVTPSATALVLTARPVRIMVASTAIGVVAVVGGLTLAAVFNLPPSFFIVSITTAGWLAAMVARHLRRRAAVRSTADAEPDDPHAH